ncbi:MAG: Fe-S-containing protein [Candidatus Korobacteraceae bacterium]
MLEAFIITLREGVEAALIVGITLVYLRKIGRPELRSWVFSALFSALATSVVLAAVISRLGLDQEAFEGWIMLTAAFFVITMIVFMARASKRLKGDIEGRVGELASAGSRFGLFAFVFLMILREGVETVLILSAVSLNTTELLSLLGTLAGVALSVLFGVSFVKGSLRVNLRKFFGFTTVFLIFVAIQLVVSGLHELSERGIIPATRQSMAIIGPIVRNDFFFFVTILALAALMILFEYRSRQPETAVELAGAERRKTEWTARRERMWMSAVYGSAFVFILLVTAQFIYAKSLSELSPATQLVAEDNEIRIPLAQVSDGDLHRFVTLVDGHEVRFFLMQRPDGQVAALFDSCEICGPVGFYRSSDGVTCKNCSAPINTQSLGQAGGCNPVPLTMTESGDSGVIRLSDLREGVRLFQAEHH